MEIEFKKEDFEKFPGTPEQLKMRRKWVDALRSGNYKQTKGTLKDENGFCCLGVLCDIVHPEGWDESFLFKYKNKICDTMLSEDIISMVSSNYSSFGIDAVNIRMILLEDKIVFSRDNDHEVFYSSLNDTYELTFDQIADIIEYTYEIEPKE